MIRRGRSAADRPNAWRAKKANPHFSLRGAHQGLESCTLVLRQQVSRFEVGPRCRRSVARPRWISEGWTSGGCGFRRRPSVFRRRGLLLLETDKAIGLVDRFAACFRDRRNPGSVAHAVRLRGHQEGRFFHSDSDCYGYLPLYVFCGHHLQAAKLRRSNIDASAGSVDEMARIVGSIRAAWPKVKMMLRPDSGFARASARPWPKPSGSGGRPTARRRVCSAISCGRPRQAGRAGTG